MKKVTMTFLEVLGVSTISSAAGILWCKFLERNDRVICVMSLWKPLVEKELQKHGIKYVDFNGGYAKAPTAHFFRFKAKTDTFKQICEELKEVPVVFEDPNTIGY
jgi:hypothetical protein